MTTYNPTLIIILLFAILSSSLACHPSDMKALIAIKNSFISSSLNATWNDSTDCCKWNDHNIICDKTTGRVTTLQFFNDSFTPDEFLVGNFPSAVGDLSELKVLMFSNFPALVGPIPPSITKLKKLLTLYIIGTSVSGPVPSFLSQLTALKQIYLGRNLLSGKIPPSLGSLVNLTYIGLYNNQLTGNIPGSLFSKLAKGRAAYLQLSSNKLTGRIPESFGRVKFQQIDLDDNKLHGDGSLLFGKSKSKLESVNLTRNGFKFDFGKLEFPAKLQRLDVSRNKIYGSIPAQIVEADLVWLDLSYNELCGEIPTGGNLVWIGKEAYAHNKCLCGAPLEPCK